MIAAITEPAEMADQKFPASYEQQDKDTWDDTKELVVEMLKTLAPALERFCVDQLPARVVPDPSHHNSKTVQCPQGKFWEPNEQLKREVEGMPTHNNTSESLFAPYDRVMRQRGTAIHHTLSIQASPAQASTE